MTATRALIVRENMRYARRQMTWFRGEPDVHWIEGPGESPRARDAAVALVSKWLAADARTDAPGGSPGAWSAPGVHS